MRITLYLFALFAFTLPHAASADYSQHPQAQALIRDLVYEGLNREELEGWLAQAEKQQRIIDLMNKPAEKTKPWFEYRKHFITDKRINDGLAFWNEHEETLNRVSEEYGVEPEIIVAIIGVETSYGRITGSFRVIDALSTLAFDYPSRSPFFTSELKNFFHLAKEQAQDPLSLKGSYAGAMGYGQFMPSSYRNFAQDHDKDGFADIWNNPEDAIASVANYFAKHGWRKGEISAVRARVTPNYNEALVNQLTRDGHSPIALVQEGFTPATDIAFPTTARPLKLELDNGAEFWLGLHNFYVISRYNPRVKYAMAVFQLSELLKQQKG